MPACILVVDDDPSTCEALAEALHEEGYEVIAASHSDKALELAHDLTPDLILLDVNMPGLNGQMFIEVYRQQTGSQAPIVLISAMSDLAAIAAELQVADFLDKPFSVEHLLSVVHAHVDSA